MSGEPDPDDHREWCHDHRPSGQQPLADWPQHGPGALAFAEHTTTIAISGAVYTT